MKNTTIIYSVITFITLLICNLIAFIFTLIYTIEQIKTGFGFGTNTEMFVIFPLITAILSIPLFINGIINLIINIIDKFKTVFSVTNLIQTIILLLQYLIIYIFIIY